MTTITQLPGTIQPVSLADIIPLSQVATGGGYSGSSTDVQAPLSAVAAAIAPVFQGYAVPLAGGIMTGSLSVPSLNLPGRSYDPRAYGGTWDGVADVSGPIQAAINAAQSAGTAGVPIVELPAGILPVLNGLTIAMPGNLMIRGQGRSTIVTSCASISLFSMTGTACPPVGVPVAGSPPPNTAMVNVTLKDFVCDGGGQTSANTCPLITCNRIYGFLFDGLTLQNTGSAAGMRVQHCQATMVRACRFISLGNRWKTSLCASDRYQGLILSSGDDTSLGFNNSVIGCYFEDIGLDAISAGEQTNLSVVGNEFNLGNGQFAILGTNAPSYAAAIFGAAPLLSNGTLMATNSGWNISGNVINGTNGNGIDVLGLQNSTIGNNAIINSGGAGIGLFPGEDVILQGTIAGTVLSVGSITSGVLWPGQVLTAGAGASTALSAPTYIVSGAGTSWAVSPPQSVAGQALRAETNVRNVAVTGNVIMNSNKGWSSIWNSGVVLGDGYPDSVTVSGNIISDNQATPTQQYGIAVINNTVTAEPTNLTVVGNNLQGNAVGPLLDASTNPSKVVANNGGITDVVGTVASSATITLPLNPIMRLTGSTAVNAVTGLTTGRELTFLPTGSVVFTAGATIGNTVTTVANVPVLGRSDGIQLYLK